MRLLVKRWGVAMSALTLSVQLIQARPWTDSTGKFTIEAELVTSKAGVVLLRKPDGQQLAVPLDKLSAADRQYLVDLAKTSRPAPADKPATAQPAPETSAAVKPKAEPLAATVGGVKRNQLRVGRAAVEQAMATRTSLKFEEQSIAEALPVIQQVAGVQVVLDKHSLAEDGMDDESPVWGSFENLSLRDGLKKILDPFSLAMVEREELLVLTTTARAQDSAMYEYRMLQIVDRTVNPNDLIDEISNKVAPETWDTNGGFGTIQAYYPRLVVMNASGIAPQIETQYARVLRPLVSNQRAVLPIQRDWGVAQRALALPIKEFDFIDEPLRDAVRKIGAAQGIEISLDEVALANEQIGVDSRVSLRLHGVRLRLALALLLEPHQLSYLPTSKGLQITTKSQADGKLFKAVYNVGDLVTAQLGEFNRLSDLLQRIVDPASWTSVGGTGSVMNDEARGTLVIEQTFSAHLKIQQLLTDLREPGKG